MIQRSATNAQGIPRADDRMRPEIPDDLGEVDRWAIWRMEAGQKVPYRVDGRKADNTNPQDWGTLERAQQALRSGHYSGLGFSFFMADGFVGVDLDDSLDSEGNAKVWARGIVERFSDSYAETSPSGHGVKIWTRGSLPANLDRKSVV